MNNQKIRKIGLLQTFCYTFFLSHFFFLFYGRKIILTSGNDTIIACVLGMILNLFIFRILLFLREHPIVFPTKIEVIKKILLIIFFSIEIIVVLDMTTRFVIMHYLNSANYFSVFFLFIIMTFIVANRNISSITSLAFLLFLCFVPLFISNIIGEFQIINFTYLKPPFTTNFFSIIKGALLFSLYSLLPLILLFFLPFKNVDQQKKQNKYLYFALILSNLCTIIGFLMIFFGTSLTYSATYRYPYMIIIRKISGFLVFNRFYFLFSIYLLFDSTIFLGGLFITIKEKILSFKKKKVL